MKKFDYKVFFLFSVIGILLWFVAALIDFLFFAEHSSLMDVLFFHVTKYEIFIRTTVFTLLIGFGIIFSYYINELEQSKTSLQNILNNVIPICITDKKFKIIKTNKSYDAIFGSNGKKLHGYCYEERPGDHCKSDNCPLVNIIQKDKDIFVIEAIKPLKNQDRHYIVTATPYLDQKGRKVGIIETFQDITLRKDLEQEKEELIDELQEALAKVKVLSGFLPICASCKKIRDDKGYWTQIETYIRNHSEAEFSHGICPECMEKHYGYLDNSHEK